MIAAIVGALSGTHTAIWGMYKDAVHEGFSRARFARSIVIGSLASILLQRALALPTDSFGALVLLFGLAYAAERGIVETWKTFVRNEDQSKYFIPMQFSIRGEPVKDARVRLAAGAVYVALLAVGLIVVASLDHRGEPDVIRIVLVGLATGLIIAVGGGWKDAPKEGFDPIKFMRSPAMTVAFALTLSLFTDSYLLMAVGAIGYERATAETYKTFFFPSKPRGKFSGKPIVYPEMMARRRYFVPAYVAIWVAVLVSGALALREGAGPVAGGGL
jgi:hypothetical protein